MKRRILLCLMVAGLTGLLSFGQAVAQDKSPIIIGAVQPLTGPVSIDGLSVVQGIKIATEKVNAAGGVLGRPISVTIEDGKVKSYRARVSVSFKYQK